MVINDGGPDHVALSTGKPQVDIMTMQVMDSQQALQEYCSRFDSEQTEKTFFGFDSKRLPWAVASGRLFISEKDSMKEELDSERVKFDKFILHQESALRSSNCFSSPIYAEDDDGDEIRICKKCNLPVGDIYYKMMDRHFIHGECAAQFMTEHLQQQENERALKRKIARDRQHATYGIGWDITQIPKNSEAATKLAMRDVSEGMVCVVLDEDGKSIRLGSTLEIAGAINLEYLSTALQVRRAEGTEPTFSLDKVDCTDDNTMQAKNYTPNWLAGTKAGDVLFQADYHLKEACMDVRAQPVVGMKSAYEHSRLAGDEKFTARTWFMVRKAEVLITDSNMLVPVVRMGVEAREQVLIDAQLEDLPVTRQDHPLLKYAAEFTRNFDLIAERKSVIYHLRELAKASVLAKYLIESGSTVEEPWFHLATFSDYVFPMEVPQLWVDRVCSNVGVQSGRVDEMYSREVHSVYGGVRFGLDKLRFSALPAPGSSAYLSVQPAAGLSAGRLFGPSSRVRFSEPLVPSATMPVSLQMPPRGRLEKFGGLSANISASLPIRFASTRAPRFSSTPFSAAIMRSGLLQGAFRKPSASLSSVVTKVAPAGRVLTAAPFRSTQIPTFKVDTEAEMLKLEGPEEVETSDDPLKGVDLRLDQFDLSEAKRVSLEAPGNGHVGTLDACVAIGSTFFSALDGSEKIFNDDDHALLKDVFHPVLSDRRCEGDIFVPPDLSFPYVNRLRQLTKEEELMRRKRKDKFLSTSFRIDEPGHLFPLSWTPTAIACVKETRARPESRVNRNLQAHPLCKTYWAVLQKLLKTAAVIFDKCAEDGCRFRIYSLGKLEVRTLHDSEGDEVLGMVFSMGDRCNAQCDPIREREKRKKDQSSSGNAIEESEKVVSVTEFVEPKYCCSQEDEDFSKTHYHYYLVCETETGHKIIMERPIDKRKDHGTSYRRGWEENPLDFEMRIAFGKVMRTQDALEHITVRHMKDLHADGTKASLSDKRLVQDAFLYAVGSKGVQLSKLFPPQLACFSRG